MAIDITAGFPEHWQPSARAGGAVDWGAAGVSKKYVLLITGRCGSTNLAELLGGRRICGQPAEYFNELYVSEYPEAQASRNLLGYISNLAATRNAGGIFGFKIDFWRLEALDRLVDFDALFPSSDTRLFVMTRRDIVAQAYSFAVARATGQWHEVGGTGGGVREHVPDDGALWREALLIASAETGLAGFLRARGRSAEALCYEDLLAGPDAMLSRIFGALAVEGAGADQSSGYQSVLPSTKGPVRKIRYSSRDDQIKTFRSRYGTLLADLEQQRHCLSWHEMAGRLTAEHGLVL